MEEQTSSIVPSRRTALPIWKRAIDLTCCLLAVPFFALTALVIASLTLATSPGPILFCQERVGWGGRRFRLYKFRTMHVGADTTAHQKHFADLVRSKSPMQKLDNAGDPRLIRGGSLLRASGLDELPQILNVLRGEMSIVGPRPCIPYEYNQYTDRQKRRFDSVPGLTGLWQVSGKNQTTFDEMIGLDVLYARRRSLALDLKIILLTPRAIYRQCFNAAARRRGRRATTARSPMSVSQLSTNPPGCAGQPELAETSPQN